jgi:hypothetical protein
MTTQQYTEQHVQNYRGRAYKTRPLNQALTHTYASFAEQYPEWVAALFDEYFLTHQAMPLLARSVEDGERLDPAELAKAWSEQLTWFNEEHRQSIIADLIPVAASFLRTFEVELFAASTWV